MPANKLYYTITEVAELTGVAPHILRYWEKEFRALSPRRSSAGVRQYQQRDIATVREIFDLLYSRKFTIKGAKIELKKPQSQPIELALPPVKKQIPDVTPQPVKPTLPLSPPAKPEPSSNEELFSEEGIQKRLIEEMRQLKKIAPPEIGDSLFSRIPDPEVEEWWSKWEKMSSDEPSITKKLRRLREENRFLKTLLIEIEATLREFLTPP